MLKSSNLTVRVKPDTRLRLDRLAQITKRSKSYVIEEALEQYLEVNEWQIKGIMDAVAEAESSNAEFVDHAEVLKARRKKVAR
jgi:predicted transcriptional regulator